MQNRSVPTSTLLPHIVYRDVATAIVWLSNAFGFTEHFRYGDPVRPEGAQIHLGDAWIMLSTPREDRNTPGILGGRTQFLTIFVDDVTRHYRHSISRRVKLVEELHETVSGERQYAAEDLDGHLWIFSQHARDLSPTDWGATLAQP
jgi:uncharacterized glyoxalase superfamily protein PhnB